MDKATYVQHFLRVAEKRLVEILPDIDTEGNYLCKTYASLSSMLKHIKEQTEKGEDDE